MSINFLLDPRLRLVRTSYVAGSNPVFEVFADIAAAETWIAISSA